MSKPDSETLKFGPPPKDSRDKVIELLDYDDPKTWDIPWKLNVTPWTKGVYHPTLREAVEDYGIEYPTGSDKKALVPGCGEPPLSDSIPPDWTYHKRRSNEPQGRIVDSNPEAPKHLIDFQAQDFFSLKAENELDKFDLIYDYTFFVAIHPSERPEWGRQMAALIKPGGYLITVVFPMEPKNDIGPPWYLRPEHYDSPLAGSFVKILDKVPAKLPPGWPEGRQHLLGWRRM